jgi:flagellar basal-body rod protein FlgC
MVDGVKNFTALRISASGLSVQRARMDVFAENIANASTTRTEDGGPYRRKTVTIASAGDEGPRLPAIESELALARTHVQHGGGAEGPVIGESPTPGVEVAEIGVDDSEGPSIYDPTHPDADDEGYVRMPNVEIITELLSLQGAARAYEANLAAMKAEQEAARDTLRIGT